MREAVCSLMGLNRNDIEIIIIDDGSTDAFTKREIARLADEGFLVIRQENKGLAGARNAGIAASRGEYVFPLDADDRVRTGWIERAVNTLDSHPQVGVVYGDAECFGCLEGRWTVGPFSADELLLENFIHASALYRRVIWEQNGGYDGTMPVQGLEDWDFWIGALERGWEFVYMPELFFEYRQTPGSMIMRAKDFTKAVEEFVARKHGPLYREAWQRRWNQQQSVRFIARRLGDLLKLRFKQKLGFHSVQAIFGKPEQRKCRQLA